MIKKHKPKKESYHVALWNIASIVGISSAIFRNNGYMIVGCTTIVTIYHIVFLFIDDDFL